MKTATMLPLRFVRMSSLPVNAITAKAYPRPTTRSPRMLKGVILLKKTMYAEPKFEIKPLLCEDFLLFSESEVDSDEFFDKEEGEGE